MINLDSITNENKEHNEKWPLIPDHPYRILIIGGSGSGKTNTLLKACVRYFLSFFSHQVIAFRKL